MKGKKSLSRILSILLTAAFVLTLVYAQGFASNADDEYYNEYPSDVYASSVKGKTVTIKWSKTDGAAKYRVTIKPSSYNSSELLSTVVKGTSYKFSKGKLGTAYSITVRAIKANGKESSLTGYGTVYTAPATPSKLKLYRWTTDTDKPYFEWTGYNYNNNGYYVPDGYQVKVMTLKGKKIKTFNVSYTSLYENIKKIKNSGFKVQIRSYEKMEVNGKEKRVYSKWSKKKAFVAQPKMGGTYQYNGSGANLSWKAISNASKYTIYTVVRVGTTNGSKYKLKKYKTVGGGTRSVRVKKGAMYTILPEVKVGGKKYSCKQSDYTNITTVTFPR